MGAKIWHNYVALLKCPYTITLCTTKEQNDFALDDMEIPAHDRCKFPTDKEDCYAETHLYEEEKTIVICVSEKGQNIEPHFLAAALCHEAVHIWQHCEDYYKEHRHSKEGEAYAVQFLTEILFQQYMQNSKIYSCMKNGRKTK